MDKLFQNRFNENKTPSNRRSNESKNDNDYMETMEEKSQESVGIAQTRNTNEASNSNGKNGRPIYGSRP